MAIDRLVRVVAGLGASVDMSVRWNGEALDRLLDEDHAAIVDALVALYEPGLWETAVEVSFAIAGERGSVDLLAYRPDLRLVVVNEVKSVVPDAQATIHAHDRKSRLALSIAHQRGWRADRVARILVIGDNRTARRRVERHDALFRAAYPLRGRELLAWLRSPSRPEGSQPISGLLFLSAARGAGRSGGVTHRHRIRAVKPRSGRVSREDAA